MQMSEVGKERYEVSGFSGKHHEVEAGGLLAEVIVNVSVDELYIVFGEDRAVRLYVVTTLSTRMRIMRDSPPRWI